MPRKRTAMDYPQSKRPPANTLERLAADLLAQRARTLLDQLAHAGWEPAVKLQTALDTYDEVRSGNLLKDTSDPQCMRINGTAPDTESSVHLG